MGAPGTICAEYGRYSPHRKSKNWGRRGPFTNRRFASDRVCPGRLNAAVCQYLQELLEETAG